MVAAGRGWQQVASPSSTKKRVQQKRTAAKKTSPKKVASKKTAPKKGASKKGANKGDPVHVLLAKMAEMYQLNIMDVEESILLKATGYARSDSTGYRNATKKVIKELGYVEKKKTIYTLTDSGREHLLETGDIKIPDEPKTTEEHHEQLLANLVKHVTAPNAKIEIVFETLQDGEWHTISDLLKATGYGRTDSTGYRNIMAGLKTLDLLEKDGKKYRFSDKAFKFGRP